MEYKRVDGRTLRYMTIRQSGSPHHVAFIHGSPGSSADFLPYFLYDSLCLQVNLLSVDRPGYGYSDFGEYTPIDVQADVIAEVLRNAKNGHPYVLVCHSYGGPVAGKIAMDHPELVRALIMLAPAIDPELEVIWLAARIAAVPAFGKLVPAALRVASEEKLHHAAELMQLESHWKKIQCPVCHVHGTDDLIVPYRNILFSKKHIDPRLLHALTLKGAGHFLPWTHQSLVMDLVNQYVQTDNKKQE